MRWVGWGLTVITRLNSVLNWTCIKLANWNWAWQQKQQQQQHIKLKTIQRLWPDHNQPSLLTQFYSENTPCLIPCQACCVVGCGERFFPFLGLGGIICMEWHHRRGGKHFLMAGLQKNIEPWVWREKPNIVCKVFFCVCCE